MKPRFNTSWDTYHRILWDPQFNERVFAIGYYDRMSAEGIREKPVIEWSSSDIPWNRVRYIACGSIVVWHRDKRLDLFETGDLPAAAYNPIANQATTTEISQFLPKPVHRFKGPKWGYNDRPVTNVKLEDLTVATYNILSDQYKVNFVSNKERILAVLAELEACNADILVLQEVTIPILKQLLDADFLREWYVSDLPNQSHFHTHRVVILSKYAFELEAFDYSGAKQFQVATWQINDEYFRLCGVHLSSNRADNAEQVRKQQLETIVNYLSALSGNFMIAGDFNMRGEEGVSLLQQHQLLDVWTTLRPKELGYTFDTTKNKLAAFFSLSKTPGRFDRLILKENTTWKSDEIKLFGNKPLTGQQAVFPSDHFGLQLRLVYQQKKETTTDIQPTYKSALVLIPQDAAWEKIQPLREKYDSKYERWMPHITLVYGFWPAEHFEQAAERISEIVAMKQPFSVRLDAFGFFTHRANVTAYLHPISVAINPLQAALQAIFPNCKEQSDRPAGFTPHLSIGQFDSVKTAQKTLPQWKPMTFQAASVALISRVEDAPFEVKCTVELGTGKVVFADPKRHSAHAVKQLVDKLSPSLTAAENELREFAVALVQEACSEVLGFPVVPQTLGSSRLGTASPTSDIDLVCLIPQGLGKEDFFEQLQEKLIAVSTQSTLALDASTPILRLVIEGVSMDILCAQQADFPAAAATIKEDDRSKFDEESWRAFAGVLEADRIMELVNERLSLADFRDLVRAVRAWAKLRGLKGNAWGFLGNYSWTVLAAWACLRLEKSAELDLPALLHHFFKEISRHDWKKPIALTAESAKYKHRGVQDRMPIVTTVKPFFNSARNITQSTAKVLQSEFNLAFEMLKKIQKGKATWANFFEERAHKSAQLKFKIEADDAWNLEQAKGWFGGNIVGLLVGLEKELGAFVYPVLNGESNASEVSLCLSLPEGYDKQRLEWVVADFVGRFEEENGAGLTWFF